MPQRYAFFRKLDKNSPSASLPRKLLEFLLENNSYLFFRHYRKTVGYSIIFTVKFNLLMKKYDFKDLKPIGVGYFGEIYDQFRGRVKEAFDFLIARQSGDLLGVFYNDKIGEIDLVWGSDKEGRGLDHIIRKHIVRLKDFESVEEVRNRMEDVIKKGKIVKDKWDKATVEKDGFRVVISKNVRDNQGNIVEENKNWVVTSFDNNRPKSQKEASATTTVTPDSNSEGRAVASDAVS